MTLRTLFAASLLAGLLIIFPASGQQILAQTSNQSSQTERKDDETNLDTQLYLLVATNQDVDETKLPPALGPVIKQLRASLPFKNYRLAATLINRVKNEGRLNLRWVGGPLLASASSLPPTFNEFRVRTVKFVADAEGQPVVRLEGFAFGARIPVQTQTVASAGAAALPIINYENTGLDTDISMREGEPVVVGTLNVGPSGEAIILVMSAQRTPK